MLDPTNKPMEITLKGKKYVLYFNLNTFSAFEDVTGRFFLDFLVDLQDTVFSALAKDKRSTSEPEGEAGEPKEEVKVTEKSALQFLRKIPAKEVRAFIWAALHTYDKQGDPQWPFTMGQLGAMIDAKTIMQLLPSIISGAHSNMPDADKEEEGAEDKENPTTDQSSLLDSGGILPGPSPEEVLALMEEK